MDTIRSIFPELVIDNISFAGSGNESDAYYINNDLVFKFPKNKEASRKLVNELAVLDKLDSKLPFSVPRVLYRTDMSSLSENSFAGYSRISGTPITPDYYLRLSAYEQDRLAADTASFLLALHSQSSFDLKGNNILGQIQEDCTLVKKVTLPKIKGRDKELLKSLLYIEPPPLSKEKALIHGDFSSSHIFFDNKKNQVSAIIDFADACFDYRYWDFMYLLEDSDEELGHEFRLNVMRRYGLDQDEIRTALSLAEYNESIWPAQQIALAIRERDNELLTETLRCIGIEKSISI
nr:APH [uncultured bacterium]